MRQKILIKTDNYQHSRPLEKLDIREILTFSGWDGTEIPEHFVRDFYPWELIYEIGAINSGVKSGV